MTRTLWIIPLFIVGVGSLMIFNIMILGLGDPKFPNSIETALGFYFPIWLVLFMPQMIVGWLLLTVNVPASSNQTFTVTGFTILILFATEVSFTLDLNLLAIAAGSVVVLLATWLIRYWLIGTV